MAKNGFLIGATSSGCGKTTLSLGLMRVMSGPERSVQPFKCGPDYIDTQFHTAASGNRSINLDTFMSSEWHVRDLFSRYSADKDIAIVEGVMGLFDGHTKMKGSSAELAQILSLRTVLLVDASSTAYSVAPIIYGFRNFNPSVDIAGVIFNKVSSQSHFSFLKDACEDAGVECLGYMKKDDSLVTPSRHLGLTLTAKAEMEHFIQSAADVVAENVDVERLLRVTEIPEATFSAEMPDLIPTKIAAVAFDEAFNFIYKANLDALRAHGYEIVFFSPVHDKALPHADLVYIPGGYPELFAPEISDNVEMKESVRKYAAEGGRMWAECGGLIYLAESMDGMPMCGIFPFESTMEHARLSLGYRTVKVGNAVFKGHEFHYSRLIPPITAESVAVQKNVRNKTVDTQVFHYRNVFASYTHLYWGDNDLLKLWQS